jgi:hypothetical protein
LDGASGLDGDMAILLPEFVANFAKFFKNHRLATCDDNMGCLPTGG